MRTLTSFLDRLAALFPKIVPVLLVFLLGLIFHFGYHHMYFHQDDITYLINSTSSVSAILAQPVNEHLHYIFRLFFKLEWQLFGLHFPLYLFVNLLLHLLNILVLVLIVTHLTKAKFWAYFSALIFTLNTNWNETTLWVSGQTIALSSLLVFWAYYWVLKFKASKFTLARWLFFTITLILPGITSGLGIWFPLLVFFFYGIDYRKRHLTWQGTASLLSLLVFVVLYATRSHGLTSTSHFSIDQLGPILTLAVVAFANTAVGRTLIPWDHHLWIRLFAVFIFVASIIYKAKKSLLNFITKDRDFQFALGSLVIYYLVIAAGRVQYGLGIARAERYAYMGLIFALILLTRYLSSQKINKGLVALVAFFVVLIQLIGFYDRALPYTQRPLQVKHMLYSLKDSSGCYADDYLPAFVSPVRINKFSELLPLIQNPNLSISSDPSCKTFSF